MEAKKREAHFYKDAKGKEPAREWLEKLRDPKGKAKVLTRINRATDGNFGDHKAVGDGVSELRIDSGPGYRLYYAVTEDDEIILLLVGGDKSSQQKDIEKAKDFWKEHKG